MLTPMIGMEPTLGLEPQSIAGDSNARTENLGDFEAVLEDLLDTDTEPSALVGWASPILLNLTPALAELSIAEPKVGLDGLQAIAPDLSIANNTVALLEGSEFEYGDAAAPTDGHLTAEQITPEIPAQAGDAAIASPEQMGQQLLGAEVPEVASEGNSVAQQNTVVLGGDLPSGKGALETPSISSDALSSSGDEGVSPVSSARQGETLSSQLPADSEVVEPIVRELERASEPRRATLEPNGSSDPTPRVSALQGAPHTQPVVQAEPSRNIHSAQPDWNAIEQVAQHIERMVYNRERDSITVRLDPPELGIIELRIQASGGEVQAWVSAERDLTRQLLQQAQQQLREQLESRGLQLTHFDVGGQNNPHFAQARPFRTPATQSLTATHPSTATDSLSYYDGRWSVWV